MRISDWSSDVCSSDLDEKPPRRLFLMATSRAWSRHASCLGAEIQWYRTRGPSGPLLLSGAVHATQRHVGRSFHGTDDRQGNPNRDPAGTDHPVPRAGTARCRVRSEGRREGKECVSTFKTRWASYN